MKSRFHTTSGRWGILLVTALLLAMMAMPAFAEDASTTTDPATATETTSTDATTTPDTTTTPETTAPDTTAEANATLKVMVDGEEINYGDAPPIVQDNRTYVGVRALALALGVPEAGINWDGATSTATLTKDTTVVKLVLNSNTMLVNDVSQTMDAAPFASNNRTYLPVRYLAEALGFTVEFDEVANQALITSPAAPEPAAEELTAADSGTTLNLAPGASRLLALESNPSTGYSWQTVLAPDAAIVTVSDVQFEAGPADVVGAPGTDRWLLTGVAAGTTTLQLDYVGPGTDAVVGNTFTLTIVVE